MLTDGPLTSPNTATAPVEWAVPPCLTRLAAVHPAQMCEMIEAFVADTASRLQRMRAALGKNDFAVVSQEAHCMIGSSSQVGAGRLPQLLRLAETAARKGVVDWVRQSVDELDKSFAEVRDGMNRYLLLLSGLGLATGPAGECQAERDQALQMGSALTSTTRQVPIFSNSTCRPPAACSMLDSGPGYRA